MVGSLRGHVRCVRMRTTAHTRITVGRCRQHRYVSGRVCTDIECASGTQDVIKYSTTSGEGSPSDAVGDEGLGHKYLPESTRWFSNGIYIVVWFSPYWTVTSRSGADTSTSSKAMDEISSGYRIDIFSEPFYRRCFNYGFLETVVVHRFQFSYLFLNKILIKLV